MGGEVLATKHAKSVGGMIYRDIVEAGLFLQWRTSSLAFLNTLPSEYIYRREFEDKCKESNYYATERGLAILQAAKDDIAGGYLQKVTNLVSASVFSDFLEMAEHLLDNGHNDPAASLIGAVLENGLRRICESNDLVVKADDNISSLNKKISDKNIYNRLQQREIEAWNKLRDYADHGHFNEYNTDKVRNMFSGVRSFLMPQLS